MTKTTKRKATAAGAKTDEDFALFATLINLRDSVKKLNDQGDKQGKPMQFRLKAEYCIEWDLFLDPGEEEGVSIREVYPEFISFLWRPEYVAAPGFDYLAWDEEVLTEMLLNSSG